MNWQQLSEPPHAKLCYESVAFAQMDWHDGLVDENAFIGLLNVIFDVEWEMANPGFSALDTCDTTPAVLS